MTIKNWIGQEQAAFLAFLEKLVNVNTFTDNTAGVDHGMDLVSQRAQEMGFHVEVINGRHRLIRAGNGRGKRILLITHIDTVHPPDGAFQTFEPLADDFVRGPGIGDMKAGLVMGLWAMSGLSALRQDFDVQMVVSADEEIGSPGIRDWYLAGKSGAVYGVGLEPGFPQGKLTPDAAIGVVQQRKGSGRIHFTIRGKAAHSGGAWQDGLSAIEAAARRILKIHALTDPQRGITTNVGLVQGGTTANTIAERCNATVDFRFLTASDGEQVRDAILEIIHTPTMQRGDLCDTVDDIDASLYMPPMEHTPENQYLVDVVLREAARLGQPVQPIVRGGGSDANWISSAGVPCICGMGAPAESIHTPEEKILVPLMFARLELLINVLSQLIA